MRVIVVPVYTGFLITPKNWYKLEIMIFILAWVTLKKVFASEL
mgnify:CR=1 FL=1